MNTYYTKLDSISPILYKNFENLGEQHVCGGGWTKYYETNLSRNILLPDELKHHFHLSYMTFIGDNAHPHVDLEIGCRINIYLSENNCPTKFFSVKAKEFEKPLVVFIDEIDLWNLNRDGDKEKSKLHDLLINLSSLNETKNKNLPTTLTKKNKNPLMNQKQKLFNQGKKFNNNTIMRKTGRGR